jgi:multidrug transporter EmrE-like cation transporter
MRDRSDLWLMAGYAISTVGGVLLLKYAVTGLRAGFSSGAWQRSEILAALAGCIPYVAGAAFWLVILSRHDLSIVFPIAVAVTVLGTTAAAMVLFGESLTAWRAVGCILIIAGVTLVARG